jgi:hypothetical protein
LSCARLQDARAERDLPDAFEETDLLLHVFRAAADAESLCLLY